jgi:xanthine dehydrogenase molybdenum-binding subunit
MSEKLSVVGKSMPRWKGRDKATGAARYGADIKLPGMLVGRILFSPHAHARVVSIDTHAAEQLPGVEAVITWKDVPDKVFNPGPEYLIMRWRQNEIEDMRILTNTARHVGDRIAAVAAVDAATAEKALALIHVTYELLPAVTDPFEAMKPGAPRVHDAVEDNVPLRYDWHAGWGDVDKGYEESDLVVEETFSSADNHICQMEPGVAIADFSSEGKLTIWSSTQLVFPMRRKIADLFGMREGSINMVTPHVGGAFGKYCDLYVEPICIALALKLGRPVKIELSREEDLLATLRRQKFIATAKMGVKKDGSIVALEENLIVDGGAYAATNVATANVNISCFLGLYRTPSAAASATLVYTNVPPTGGCRGYGNHEGTSMLEQLVDMAAARIGMDPLEMRLRNIKCAGDRMAFGLLMETCALEEIIKLGARRIGWKEKRARPKENGAKRYGIGMGIAMDVSGAQPTLLQVSNALVKLDDDGCATVFFNLPDIGQNVGGTIAQIAAETLGLEYGDVHIVNGETDLALFDTGVQASCATYRLGSAVIAAAEDARNQLLELAAQMLDVSSDQLAVEAGRVFDKSSPDKGLSVGEVVRIATYEFDGEPVRILGKGYCAPKLNPPPSQAVFCEVEVDVETGVTTVLRVLYVADSGTIINPSIAAGQVHGAIQMSLGYTLTEDYVVNPKTGVLESTNLNTYRVPGILDMPDVEVIFYEDAPVSSGPFGAKGLSQGSMCGVTPSIMNAIHDATGVVITDMPATPERLLDALQKARIVAVQR